MTVLHELLETRGYVDITYSIDGYQCALRNDIAIELIATGRNAHDDDDDGESIKVYAGLNINKPSFQSVLYNMIAQSDRHAIIIYKLAITPAVKTMIQSITNTNIEIFSTNELSINPLAHRLVPRHSRIPKTADEYQDLKQLQMISKLPVISSSDIISRFLNFRKGDLIKIQRPETAEFFTIAYRLCK